MQSALMQRWKARATGAAEWVMLDDDVAAVGMWDRTT